MSPAGKLFGAPPRGRWQRSKSIEPTGTPPWCAPIGPRLVAASDHGDIKDASNGASGGSCAHPRALKAVHPSLHHARLAARQPAQRQHGMRCSWRSRRPEAVRCTDFKLIEFAHCCWLLKLGPRLTKANIEYAIFAEVAVSPYKMAASTPTLQPLAGPRAAVGRSAAVLCLRPTTSSSRVLLLRLEHSSHALPRP